MEQMIVKVNFINVIIKQEFFISVRMSEVNLC